MSVSVQCEECNQPFIADKEHIGKRIKCPRCMHVNLVKVDDDWEDDEADEYQLAFDDDAPGHQTLGSELLREAAENPEARGAGGGAGSPREPAPQPKGSECKSCGAIVPPEAVQCPECGDDTELKRRASNDPFEVEQLDGVQGWVQNVLSEGESVVGVLVLAGLFVVFMMGILTKVFWPWFMIISIPTVLLLVVYGIGEAIVSRNAGYQFAWLWSMMLGFGRMTGWRYLRFNAKRRVITRKNQSFTDKDLAEIADPPTVDVLDLEGTQLTDNAKSRLAEFTGLRFLVIKGTGLSAKSVEVLQAQLRNTWIWHE